MHNYFQNVRFELNLFLQYLFHHLKLYIRTKGLWSVYTISNDGTNTVEKDLVQILHFENNYAFVSGTLKDGDLVVLGGLSKIIEGQTL